MVPGIGFSGSRGKLLHALALLLAAAADVATWPLRRLSDPSPACMALGRYRCRGQLLQAVAEPNSAAFVEGHWTPLDRKLSCMSVHQPSVHQSVHQKERKKKRKPKRMRDRQQIELWCSYAFMRACGAIETKRSDQAGLRV